MTKLLAAIEEAETMLEKSNKEACKVGYCWNGLASIAFINGVS